MPKGPFFDGDALLSEAEKLAGSNDWGDDGFREAYDCFINSLNAEADLTPQGVERTRSHLMKLLTGRLRLFADRKTYPAIQEEEVKAPIFLTGHGRSGTSYLYELLSIDPQNHAPRHWQVWNPSPPPNHPDTDNAPQIAAGEHYIQFEGWQDPDLRVKHDYSNLGSAEDLLIHDYSFVSKTFPFFWAAPSYGKWLAGADAAAAYRIERKFLQALQFGEKRNQWVLKTPVHMSQLSALWEEFPDARMIVNHRDPVKTLASMMGLLRGHRKQFGNPPPVLDRNFVVAYMEGAARSAEDMMEKRADPKVNATFVDVLYQDLEADPLGQVEKIYTHHGLDLTDAVRDDIRDYVAKNRKGKFGAHKYSLAEVGLSVEEVRERFKRYTDHFDIPLEESAS
ncbi:sulfotransferase family protein [Novosphingobium pentaromativorans]|uniref:Sulfotransferase n=1 Tax=Novosphingobium pentaromativorans US6-1 TaxID=1088721 RepID=G6E868_9SPHN|nr:sulfotransferase [Novosphingobium pentaromativorans]AIT81435.1 hypothetical protein JI59_17410 [Novosphingobium pentaromativorans US6-1]EHJ62408.1 hypothetical protein NSU_0539 [Novosphingobium pentaromativorans US6-1]